MKFLFGRGPLDFLWAEDINTELPPPLEKAPEDPKVPQAFLDAAPIIADPSAIQAIEERGYDG